MPAESSLWYVMINDAETGPLTRVELGVELASGSISSESLVWKDGMLNWLPGRKVPELESLFKNPPRSPRATGVKPPPPPKPQAKGMGLSDFDTSHFRLADLKAEDGGQSRALEFDTAHFKLADLKAQQDADANGRQMEFDTGHFRLQDLKGVQGARASVPKRINPKGVSEEPIIPVKAGKAGIKQASTSAAKNGTPPPVAVRAAPGAPSKPAGKVPPPVPEQKAAKRPLPQKAESGFDPNSTSVDFRTLGALVEKQRKAQSVFESEIVPDEAAIEDDVSSGPHAAQMSDWAAQELSQSGNTPPPAQRAAAEKPADKSALEKKADLAAELKAKAMARDLNAAKDRNWIPTATAVLGAVLLAAFLVWYLMSD